MSNTNNSIIKVGTRIYTGLYNRGIGTIVAVHGKQQPQSVRRLFNGIGATGGNAEFDIIFNDGRKSDRLPECILLGVQWEILDSKQYPIATEQEINELIKLADDFQKEAAKEAKMKAEEKERQRQYYLNSDEFKHLKPCPNYPSLKHIHSNIRSHLKKHFPNVKFSVRGDYNSVYVSWTDGARKEDVEAIAELFESYKNDWSGDFRDSDPTPFNDIFGGKKYVSCEKHFSEKLVIRAINVIWRAYHINYDKPIPQDYFNGDLWDKLTYIFPRGLSIKIREVCNKLKSKNKPFGD